MRLKPRAYIFLTLSIFALITLVYVYPTESKNIPTNSEIILVDDQRGEMQAGDTFTAEATAYTHAPAEGDINGTGDGLTATGLEVDEGIVAVDPSVIEYGSILYIEGYGYALAADTGGAIEGKRIDLFFECAHQAMEFGRQDVEVTVIE